MAARFIAFYWVAPSKPLAAPLPPKTRALGSRVLPAQFEECRAAACTLRSGPWWWSPLDRSTPRNLTGSPIRRTTCQNHARKRPEPHVTFYSAADFSAVFAPLRVFGRWPRFGCALTLAISARPSGWRTFVQSDLPRKGIVLRTGWSWHCGRGILKRPRKIRSGSSGTGAMHSIKHVCTIFPSPHG